MLEPHLSEPRKRATKWLLLLAKLAVIALLIWGVRSTLESAFEKLGEHTWQVQPAWLVLAGVFYLLGFVTPGIFWHRLLRSAQQRVTLGETLRVFFLSQLGKYVPGKAMVVVMRVAMLRRSGAEATIVIASVFLETLTTMAVGSLTAALMLAIWVDGEPIELQLWHDEPTRVPILLAAIVLFVATALPTLPPVFKTLIRWMRIDKLNPTAIDKVSLIAYPVLATGWVGIAVGWLIQGLSLWATLLALGAQAGGPFDHLPLHTAVIALAVVAGFLTLIPGGLGVRELVLTPLLAAYYDADVALISAVMWRVVGIVAEIIVSTILYWMAP